MPSMKLRSLSVNPAEHSSELLIVPVFESELDANHVQSITAASSGLFAAQAATEKFSGKHGSTMVQFSGSFLAAPRTVYVGMGERSKLDQRRLRKGLESAFAEAKRLKVSNVSLQVPDLASIGLSADDFGRAVGETAGTVDYVMNHQKTSKGGHTPEVRLSEVVLVGAGSGDAALASGMRQGYAIARSVNLARDLVTEPSGTMTPSRLAREAKKVAADSNGAVTVKLYHAKELAQMGANCFLAVGRGSAEAPVLIEMDYSPAGADPNVLLTLIGKSVTFDSGGYDLKPSAGMRHMKCDMGGGAATLAAMSAISSLKLPVRVKVLMAATENMVSGKAMKPGDVLHSMAGLTVEVDNTDAEGRLTLADAIEFAKRNGATHIVDVATLTGAIRVALGSVGAGAFGNTPEFTRQVINSGSAVGELAWEMPLWEELARANDSKIADLKNSGGDAGAGSITAAHFLSRFAGKTPWVHLDIAAVAFVQEQGTGWGVRTLVELARQFSVKSGS